MALVFVSAVGAYASKDAQVSKTWPFSIEASKSRTARAAISWISWGDIAPQAKSSRRSAASWLSLVKLPACSLAVALAMRCLIPPIFLRLGKRSMARLGESVKQVLFICSNNAQCGKISVFCSIDKPMQQLTNPAPFRSKVTFVCVYEELCASQCSTQHQGNSICLSGCLSGYLSGCLSRCAQLPSVCLSKGPQRVCLSRLSNVLRRIHGCA